MNPQRRKLTEQVKKSLETSIDVLETVRFEEEGAYEQTPESFKDVKGFQVVCDTLDAALTNINNAVTGLDELLRGKA